jgi:hypothetical protein
MFAKGLKTVNPMRFMTLLLVVAMAGCGSLCGMLGGGILDVTTPTVTLVTPADAAIDVPINDTLTATFIEAMVPSTLTTTTFRLIAPGATPVTGTVAYDAASHIATYAPASNLAPSTTYTAMITTGVKDLAGNALAGDFIWSFTTAAAPGGQAPVGLGSASTFAVLAGSTVTNVPAVGTVVTGDIGVSPGTAVTGFPPGIVNGTIYSASPGPAATAKLDLTTAYLDAQGRTVGSQALPGNIGGLTFTPGLYTNATSVILSGSGPGNNVTLDAQGNASAVFIFQMGSTLTTAPGSQVILSGGAKASNVYWQVGSSATIDTTTIFKGNILAQVSITLNAGATLEGRALTQTGEVSLSSSIITIPAP